MPKPFRCFDGTAQPYEPFWRFRNAVEPDGEPEMELYGYISEYSWYDDDITPKKFKNDLLTFGKGGPITIRMNSGGGDVFAASVMRAALMDYPGQVTVKIDGLAASAATIVAMAADKILMNESAYMMIHDPAVTLMLACLALEDLVRLTNELKTIKSGIIDAYETRSKLDPGKIAKMMSAETWMTARQAVDLGFADVVLEAPQKSAAARAFTNALTHYVNVPADLLPVPTPIENSVGESIRLAAERLRAEVKILI